MRPVLRPGVLLVALAGAVYITCQILSSRELPSKGAWSGREPLSLLLAGTGAFTAFFGALVLYGYSRSLKKGAASQDLEDACKGLWHVIVGELAMKPSDMKQVGVHVWSVRGFKGARFLERRATFTLLQRGETRIFWRKGKGVIGTAWTLSEPIVADIEKLEVLAGDEVTFCGLDHEVRYGLTWSEFRKSRHYRAILAIPLEPRPNHVAGCLSIDIQLDGYAEALDTLSKVRELSTARGICEKALS